MASKTQPPDDDDDGLTTTTTILHHPIPKTNAAGSLHVYGDPASKHLVIMSAGYPDTQQAMTPMAKHLAYKMNCLVGVTCPPGYDRNNKSLQHYPDGGFTFDDWVAHLREAVKALRKYSTTTKSTIQDTTLTGIFHDWGVVMGTLYSNHVTDDDGNNGLGLKLDRMILYDVLTPPHPKTDRRPKGHDNKTTWHKVSTMCYQLVLAGTFVLQRYVPSRLSYVTLAFFAVANGLLSLFRMYPMSPEDADYFKTHIPVNTLAALQQQWYMCYPYYQFWKTVWRGKIRELVLGVSLPQDLSKIPVLFLYGANKNYHLSDANAMELLQREEAEGRPSRVVRVENAGHWLYAQQPEICYAATKQFFDATVSK
jgi:pimeloyl-ACP methyl ester carboxylesterase